MAKSPGVELWEKSLIATRKTKAMTSNYDCFASVKKIPVTVCQRELLVTSRKYINSECTSLLQSNDCDLSRGFGSRPYSVANCPQGES